MIRPPCLPSRTVFPPPSLVPVTSHPTIIPVVPTWNIKYADDYDIVGLHPQLLHYLEEKCARQEMLTHDLKEAEREMKQVTSQFQFNHIRERIAKLKKCIDDGKKKVIVNEFLAKTKELVTLYPKTKGKEREDVVDRYLRSAKEFCPLDVKKNKICITYCGCNTDFGSLSTDDNHIKVCPQCGYELCLPTSSTQDSAVTNDIGNEVTFAIITDLLDKYQGTQAEKPPIQVYQSLDNYFSLLSRPAPSEKGTSLPGSLPALQGEKVPVLTGQVETQDEIIKKNNFPASSLLSSSLPAPLGEKQEEKKKEDKSLVGNRRRMGEILSSIGLEEYLGDLNLIVHVYWGVTLPYIGHMKSLVKEDFKLVVAAKEILGLPFPSPAVLVYYLLRRHMHCDIEEFTFTATDQDHTLTKKLFDCANLSINNY